jgi:hypothetical protein
MASNLILVPNEGYRILQDHACLPQQRSPTVTLTFSVEVGLTNK